MRVSQGMTRRAKHRVSQFYHPTSHENSICGPYRLLCERAERARSKISSKSSKLSKLAQLGRILKISKTLGCRCAQVPKYILRAAEVAISQKFSKFAVLKIQGVDYACTATRATSPRADDRMSGPIRILLRLIKRRYHYRMTHTPCSSRTRGIRRGSAATHAYPHERMRTELHTLH